MSKSYLAPISVPIRADDDQQAIAAATRRAYSVGPSGGSVSGHLEFVGETRASLMEIARVAHPEPDFSQLGDNWRP